MVYDEGSLVGLCTQDYKSLCVAVRIVPQWLTPYLIFTFWPRDLESRSNHRWICPLMNTCHVHLSANLVMLGQ